MWESLAYMTWCYIFLIFLSICRSCIFSLSKCFVFWVYAGLRDLRFTKPAYTQKNQHFDAKSAKNLHILKKSKVLIVKSHQTCIYSKKSKKIKTLRLYAGLTGIDDLVFDFLDFFEYMQVWWLFPIKMFDFFEYMQVWGTWGSPNLHIPKKNNILMPKMHKACIYSKISKVLIVKSHQTCIYSKNQKNQKSQTLCGTHWHRWLGFCFSWLFWVYAGLVTFHYQNFCFFEYMQVWWLFPIKMFDFFEYMQVWGTWGSPNLHILKKSNILMPKMHKACIYSKISKVLIVKSHQTCIYSKKSKKSKISDSMWDSLA